MRAHEIDDGCEMLKNRGLSRWEADSQCNCFWFFFFFETFSSEWKKREMRPNSSQ